MLSMNNNFFEKYERELVEKNTKEITDRVTKEVTEEVTDRVTKSIAKNLKEILSDEKIAECTGLSVEIVRQL